MPGYVLGIGSNIDPEYNAIRIIERLVSRFGKLLVSRIYYTAPVGIVTSRTFVNFCAFIETQLEPSECKAECVSIEIGLGRDRNHPKCKVSDRPADIDLLAHVHRGADRFDPTAVPIDDYLMQPAGEILALLKADGAIPPAQGQVCTLPLGPITLGETPTAIDRDDRAGLVVVS